MKKAANTNNTTVEVKVIIALYHDDESDFKEIEMKSAQSSHLSPLCTHPAWVSYSGRKGTIVKIWLVEK